MKKYITPNAEMVTLETSDIMVTSIGTIDLDGSKPAQGQPGWIPEFGGEGWN